MSRLIATRRFSAAASNRAAPHRAAAGRADAVATASRRRARSRARRRWRSRRRCRRRPSRSRYTYSSTATMFTAVDENLREQREPHALRAEQPAEHDVVARARTAPPRCARGSRGVRWRCTASLPPSARERVADQRHLQRQHDRADRDREQQRAQRRSSRSAAWSSRRRTPARRARSCPCAESRSPRTRS